MLTLTAPSHNNSKSELTTWEWGFDSRQGLCPAKHTDSLQDTPSLIFKECQR